MGIASSKVIQQFAPLITPRTIAVLGASSKGGAMGNAFIHRIQQFGFRGEIYPIHPSAAEIDGLRAYKSLADTPRPVDYAYVAIPAAEVHDALLAGRGNVHFAQVISSGFGEVEKGRHLETRLVATARDGGMRILGPNCNGIYSPRGGVTFSENAPKAVGNVGVISQSGGLATDIICRGMGRGLLFSGLVTIGNCADLGPSDFLEYFLADAQTKTVGLYIETARDGRRLFEILRHARAEKPVVLLKGGRTNHGMRAAASHTGSLTSDDRVWNALSRQTGCILVETLDQFIDALLIFQTLKPRPSNPTKRVVLFGNGGGISVLATDYFARRGFDIMPFDDKTIDALTALKLPPGTSIANPVDCATITLRQDEGRIAEKITEIIFNSAQPDAVVMHLNMAAFHGRAKPEVLDNVVQAALRLQAHSPAHAHFVLVLRSDGRAHLEARKQEFRNKAVALCVPVYDEISDAGDALAALYLHERFVNSRQNIEE